MKLYDELVWRGLVKDVAGENVEEKINNGGLTFYWGTDPTADSLHLGHYSSLITAKRLMKGGHNPILLVGGATGRIGDPRPTAEREIIDLDVLNSNIEGIRKQIDDVLENKAKLVNNYDWFKGYEFLDFLRDVGKYVNVSYMLSKDIISKRLETGITYAEFSYNLIQGYDFLNMFDNMGVTMQIGGSDQWGNITTGLDLIRKIRNGDAIAFTMPLILDANGNKFGKSEGNALWLDLNKTSSYELYQYLINTDDNIVESYLKVFTFLTPEEIMDVMKRHNAEPHLRLAQKELARCIISDLHDEEEFNKAISISEKLFNGDFKGLSLKDIEIGLKGVPNFDIEGDITLLDLLVNNGICTSRREAREFLNSNSISINGEIVNDENMIINKDNAIEGAVVIVRRGKKKYFIGNIK